jgi:tripeptide aminopeptidase
MTTETASRTGVAERFLRYVTYDTQSSMTSTTYPSTPKQLVLLDRLVEELREIGLRDAARDEHGYVMATIPATTRKKDVPVIGFLAHVDTSPETSGEDVKPIVHRNWRGDDIVLPDDRGVVIRRKDFPALEEQVGNDIITASGTTLLGADNKAGVAAIMAAAEYLTRHPEIPHGVVRVGFTPDEEVGRGTERFDVGKFGAKWAYTLDAAGRGTLEMETFSADSMTVTFQGVNAHPGFAKGVMVNAVKIMASFLARLPRGTMAPEAVAGREGFVHPLACESTVERSTAHFIIRDFSTAELKVKEKQIETLARATAAEWPGSSVSFEVKESYRNMREVLEKHPQVVEVAREAIRRAGLEVRESSVRGGTDGARLCFMGLPTPNIFNGQNNFHSKLEWVSVQDMEKAVETVVHVCSIWEERAG